MTESSTSIRTQRLLLRPWQDEDLEPLVAIGWRLMPEHWGQGLASEGARATLDFGFARLGLSEIVALTAVSNVRSRRVMERLGMTYNPADDFDHPLISPGHPLQRHVLYRLTKPRS